MRRFELVREEGRYPGQADRGDLERRIAEGVPLDEGQEQAWVNGLFRVPDLYHHLVARAAPATGPSCSRRTCSGRPSSARWSPPSERS